jgi:hypothetical protein
MMLSTEQRNKLAWRFLIIRFSDMKIGVFHRMLHMYCHDAGIPFGDEARFKAFMLSALEEWSYDKKVDLGKDDLRELAWKIAIQLVFHHGIHLNASTKRDMGNKAAELDITTSEAMAFAGLLSLEVHKLIFSSNMD